MVFSIFSIRKSFILILHPPTKDPSTDTLIYKDRTEGGFRTNLTWWFYSERFIDWYIRILYFFYDPESNTVGTHISRSLCPLAIPSTDFLRKTIFGHCPRVTGNPPRGLGWPWSPGLPPPYRTHLPISNQRSGSERSGNGVRIRLLNDKIR